MEKTKSFEKKLAGMAVGFLAVAVFALAFGPNIYAEFSRQDGPAGWNYGNGYGYGSGYGANDGSYRIGGSSDDVYEYGYGYGYRIVTISTAAIAGVTAPVTGATPVTTASATDEYTAAVSWSPSPLTFAASTVYTATITLTPKTGYTVTGVTANFFTVAGSTTDTNPVDSGVVTAVFPATASSGGGGGGGGGSNAPTCTSVVYGDYGVACFAGYQYRSVVSRNPSNCALTVAQQDAAKKLCGVGVPNVDINGNGLINYQDANNTANFIALEKNLVKKVNKALVKRLLGRILLQVELHGEAWYVYPVDELKYFLGRPADAFAIMRKLSLGVSEKDYNSFVRSGVPSRLSGRILLRVQAHGEAYYVNPLDMKMYFMGRPADAFALMRRFGLGITNANLRQIGVGQLR